VRRWRVPSGSPAGYLPEHGLYLGFKRLRARHDPGLSWSRDWVWQRTWVSRFPAK
jgi:hypothetical protein